MDFLHHRYGLMGFIFNRGKKFLGLFLLTILSGMAGSATVRFLFNHYHNKALQSPIPKIEYVIEDQHWSGTYIVVRHDTKHIKLRCIKALRVGDNGGWKETSGSCYVNPVGSTIILETWDAVHNTDFGEGPMYVYRPPIAGAEDDYAIFGDD